jgi:hypothetical protein
MNTHTYLTYSINLINLAHNQMTLLVSAQQSNKWGGVGCNSYCRLA